MLKREGLLVICGSVFGLFLCYYNCDKTAYLKAGEILRVLHLF